MARGSQGSILNVFLHYSPPCFTLFRWNLTYHTGWPWTCYAVYNDLGLLILLLLPLSAKITGRCHHSECTWCWGLDSSHCACQANTLPSSYVPGAPPHFLRKEISPDLTWKLVGSVSTLRRSHRWVWHFCVGAGTSELRSSCWTAST